MKDPLDPTPYPRDPRSQPIRPGIPSGLYVYVRDRHGVVHVVPDGPHAHPRVLGNGEPAMYAGDMTVDGRRMLDLTNLSGTFQFDDAEGLLSVADELERLGFEVAPGAVVLFPPDGSTGPLTLR